MSALRIAQPGRPVVLLVEPDPYAGLTQRQRHILEVVRSFDGNRSRAARQLGITQPCVQAALRLARRAGAPVPIAVAGRKGRRDLGPRQRRVAS